MALGWIKPEEYSFNCFLLMERFQIRLMLESGGWRNNKDEWRKSMGIALAANPAVKWYFENKCPECRDLLLEIVKSAPASADSEQIRAAEVYAIASVEDFVIYTTPEKMAQNCDFIRGWNKQRLYDMADFSGKIVLDIGAGSGRLTFAAAEKAALVYASEPVDTLREYMRQIIAQREIKNVRVLDGFATEIPFPDNIFDIVMSGHVVGDDYDAEIAEMTRVCKPGGWLLDCPGDSVGDIKADSNMESRGFELISYEGSFGKVVSCYRKQISK